MIDTEKKLTDVRLAIDAIDNQMLALIDRRLELAKSLRAYKPANRAAWAPAREHALLQRLLDQKSEVFPAKTAIAMWSALITCSLMTQGSFVLLCPDDKTTALAQAAFPGAPVTTLKPNNWREQVAETTDAVAVLSFPDQDHSWWCELASSSPKTRLYVQAVLPKWPPGTQSACCLSTDKPLFRDGQVCWTLFPTESFHKLQNETIKHARQIAKNGTWLLIETDQPVDCGLELLSNQPAPVFIGSFFPSLFSKDNS